MTNHDREKKKCGGGNLRELGLHNLLPLLKSFSKIKYLKYRYLQTPFNMSPSFKFALHMV